MLNRGPVVNHQAKVACYRTIQHRDHPVRDDCGRWRWSVRSWSSDVPASH